MALRHGLGITGNNQGVVTSADHKLDQLGMVVKTGTGNEIRQGVFYNGDPNVVVGTTGMNYSVKPFTAVLSRGASAGAIFITNDGTVTLLTTAADSSNPRIDTIYVWQREYVLDGQDSEPVLGVVQGTPAAIPQAPLDTALPAGALRLADFTIPSGATNTNSGVGTQRVAFTAMHGGVVPVRTESELDTLVLADGTNVVTLDTAVRYSRSGGSWVMSGGKLPAFRVIGSTAIQQVPSQPPGTWGWVFTAWPAPAINRGFRSWLNGVLTIDRDGLYSITGNLNMVGGQLTLYRNNAPIAWDDGLHCNAVANGVELRAGDTVRLGAYQNTGSTQNLPANAGRMMFAVTHEGPLP